MQRVYLLYKIDSSGSYPSEKVVLGVFSSKDRAYKERDRIRPQPMGEIDLYDNSTKYPIESYVLDETREDRKRRIEAADKMLRKGIADQYEKNRQAVIDAGLMTEEEILESRIGKDVIG